MINRLRWHLHDLDPSLAPTARTLKHAATRHRLVARLQGLPASTVRRIALAQLAHIEALSTEIQAVEDELKPHVEALAPNLMALLGVGMLTAAKILGEVGDVARFRGPATFARHNGTAPIPVWSANEGRQRLNRGGNRQLNVARHRIAITQARLHQGAKDLLERRKQTTHDTAKDSLRVLKRHLSDVVYRRFSSTTLSIPQYPAPPPVDIGASKCSNDRCTAELAST
ncbi:transposase, partial [Couchioplanes caeruleus]